MTRDTNGNFVLSMRSGVSIGVVLLLLGAVSSGTITTVNYGKRASEANDIAHAATEVAAANKIALSRMLEDLEDIKAFLGLPEDMQGWRRDQLRKFTEENRQ